MQSVPPREWLLREGALPVLDSKQAAASAGVGVRGAAYGPFANYGSGTTIRGRLSCGSGSGTLTGSRSAGTAPLPFPDSEADVLPGTIGSVALTGLTSPGAPMSIG